MKDEFLGIIQENRADAISAYKIYGFAKFWRYHLLQKNKKIKLLSSFILLLSAF
jgi:hypothetical protein